MTNSLALTTQQEAPSAAGEYLSLRLGREAYGINLLNIQEIRRHEPCTEIAGAAPEVRGVLDLRGEIVPIVDLRCYFNLPQAVTDETVIVVLKHGAKTVGAIVDAVSDVQRLSEQQIRPLPPLHAGGLRADYIRGLAQLDQDGERRLLILLDIRPLVNELSSSVVH